MAGQENYLAMSDAEFSKLQLPDDPAPIEHSEEHVEPETDEASLDASDVSDIPNEEGLGEDEESETEENSEQEEDEQESTEDTQDDENQETDDDLDDSGSDEEKETDEQEQEVEDKQSDADKQLADLFAPFQANGREMKVDSIEEARQLMQMGANYNKKMSALKPNLKYMRMLENNKLLNEDTLSFLIDVHNKEPKAIAKLIKDSNIDPMDIDVEEGVSYKPNKSHAVSDSQVELDEVIDELKDSTGFDRTLDTVTTVWDKKSQAIVAENPGLLRVINDHIQSGVYDQVFGLVEKERAFGRLSGMSDIEAYRHVSELLARQANTQEPAQEPVQAKSPSDTNTSPKSDPALNKKKRAAAAPKSKPAKKAAPLKDFNPLGMSDAEFEKQFSSKFI